MRRAWLVGFFIAAASASGCSRPEEPGPGPLLRGTITSRAPSLIIITAQSGAVVDTVPEMLVEAVPGAGPGAHCDQAVRFGITSRTTVRTSAGTVADTAALVVGRRVSVWVFGVILDSCPAQAHADSVVLE